MGVQRLGVAVDNKCMVDAKAREQSALTADDGDLCISSTEAEHP